MKKTTLSVISVTLDHNYLFKVVYGLPRVLTSIIAFGPPPRLHTWAIKISTYRLHSMDPVVPIHVALELALLLLESLEEMPFQWLSEPERAASLPRRAPSWRQVASEDWEMAGVRRPLLLASCQDNSEGSISAPKGQGSWVTSALSLTPLPSLLQICCQELIWVTGLHSIYISFPGKLISDIVYKTMS